MPPEISRRHALKWLTGSAAGAAAAPGLAAPGETEPAPPAYPTRFNFHDPDFTKATTGPWERLLSAEELKIVTLLADIILPKDANGPAASEVGVPDFINEWISAPYDENQEDRETVRGGIGWLNTESFHRHSARFDELTADQRNQLLDDLCDAGQAKPEHTTGALFFQKFRQLCLGGYYTHSSTWKHLGYVGNITIGGPYPGVPAEIIKKLGLEDVA
jgi:Gluconate 2-dehydrogenase subunit 3